VRDLPAIDLVLVTHAHFDHLHRPSLRAIVQNNLRERGTAPTIIIPSHVTDLVSDLGFAEIIELDWWNSSRHGSVSVTHVPSRHWGARILKDSHRGYGGYVLKAGKRLGGAYRRSWRCFPSARTIRQRSGMCIRIRPMPPTPSSI
jgi:L-ascorbate metabolism protein UlaG (beta-lactamase superfamily)